MSIFRKKRSESTNFLTSVYSLILTTILAVVAYQGVDVTSINPSNLADAIANGSVIRIAIALPNFITIFLKVDWKNFNLGVFKSKNFWAQLVAGLSVLFIPGAATAATVGGVSHGGNTLYHMYRDGSGLDATKAAK